MHTNLAMLIGHAQQNLAVQGMINKYSKAEQFLNGIGLNPDANTSTSYARFNDTLILEFFRNASNFYAENTESSNQPIIGLPQANFTNFNIMALKDDIQGGMDVSYYGPLQFGTPGQELTVSIDTGSADLWIPTTCPSCSATQFTSATSSTFRDLKKKVSLVYVSLVNSASCSNTNDVLVQGAGRVSGNIAQDAVSLGSLKIDQQRFVAVKSESDDFMDYPSSGLIGLAFQSISRMNAPNFFESLLSARKLAAGIFSIHLTRGQEAGSQVCLITTTAFCPC